MDSGNKSLKPFNTFGIDAQAKSIHFFNSINALKELLSQFSNQNILILGGGSNVLFTKDFSGAVLINKIEGIDIVSQNEDEILLKVGGGVIWHDFVMHCVDNDWGGVENLSLIPGSVGASPMQNIGAYGVEIKDVFVELEALEIKTGEIKVFDHEACEFGYRESVFKKECKNQFIIVSVTYRLKKKPIINASYGAIEEQLKEMCISTPTIQDISKAVINIRNSKLPNPKEIGNAGSFFKNPVVDKETLHKIEKDYQNVPNYPAPDDKIKLAAGWLIEQAGWKGRKYNTYGVHEKQALVLVNYGGSTGDQLYNLSEQIIRDVQSKFGVTLEREVNII